MRDPAETAPPGAAEDRSAERRSSLGSLLGHDPREPLSRELIQAQKMEAIGQLVSGVAHELRNPLAAILGFSELIRLDPNLPEEMRHNAELLAEEATRTRKIVEDLLDFARQRQPERYPTSIATLVDSVLVLQSYKLGKGEIDVEVDIDPGLPLVELDRSQVQQVLVNLTQNAIHAIEAVRRSGERGRVRISAGLEEDGDGSRVRVSVEDDGVGVDPSNVPRLFEPFFTTKAPTEGTGLGLPVSHGIVAAHGGELRYEPGPAGRGAVFTFDLPVVGQLAGSSVSPRRAPAEHSVVAARGQRPSADTPADRDTSMAHSPAPGDGRRRVLVLDDERSIRVLLEKWLRASGYEVVSVSSGEEAVRAVREASFDAILCDHRMSGMSGTEVFEAVIAIRPELEHRFVFMSGDVLNQQLRQFAEARGVGLVSKPFDLDTVKRAIAGVLPRAGATT